MTSLSTTTSSPPRTMSRISLSSSSSTNPVSPKPTPPSEALRVKPNPHPYAIKTTSTGILSGSHAATTVSAASHYVPASPSPSPTKPTHSHGRGSRHRYSRSLTSDELPRPLPIPPSPGDDDHDVFQSSRPSLSDSNRTRPRRSETLPPGLAMPRLSMDGSTNPKHWSPAELAAHLASTLDVDSGLPIDEIKAFIEGSEITGMSFLRFDDGVLNAYAYLHFLSTHSYHITGTALTRNGVLLSSLHLALCGRTSYGWVYPAPPPVLQHYSTVVMPTITAASPALPTPPQHVPSPTPTLVTPHPPPPFLRNSSAQNTITVTRI